ncbi:hypothetical protein Tco_0108030, partial [Tanacetum coccineum]
MAREAELKKQRVFNTGNRVAKPVWTNANKVNQLNAGRLNINSVRPNTNTGRTNVNSIRPRVNTGSSNVNTVRSKQPVPTRTSNSFSPKRPIDRNTAKMSYFNVVKGNWGTAIKTLAGSSTQEHDKEVELIVVPSAVKIPEEKVESRTSSTNLKKEETLTEPQKEKKDSSTNTLEDNPKIQAFGRELEDIALKHLGTIP